MCCVALSLPLRWSSRTGWSLLLPAGSVHRTTESSIAVAFASVASMITTHGEVPTNTLAPLAPKLTPVRVSTREEEEEEEATESESGALRLDADGAWRLQCVSCTVPAASRLHPPHASEEMFVMVGAA